MLAHWSRRWKVFVVKLTSTKTVSWQFVASMFSIVEAWHLGKVQSETEQHIDALARAHGEPAACLAADWEAPMTGSRNVSHQTFFEDFDEKRYDGRSKPESLADVISLAEESQQEMCRPEVPKTLELHWTAHSQSQRRDATCYQCF